jgi:transcriptional regulator with XRE-family HTH domain
MKKISQNDLAAALGISASMLSRLKKRGMPVDSLTAARVWRELHLKPELTKENRYTPWRDIPRPATHDKSSHVNALGRLALHQFSEYGPILKQAMRMLPRSLRSQVSLPVSVWEALTGDEFKKNDRWEKANGIAPAPPPTAEELANPEYDPDDEAGNLIYDLAAGIVRFKEPEEL